MSKTANAFAMGMDRGRKKADLQVEPPEKRSGGNWSRMAISEMERSLRETREMHAVVQQSLIDGILQGTIPLEIPVEQIEDEVGSDRILDTPDNEEDAGSFASLVENIRTRGLRTPLRVRPKDPNWKPSEDNPREVDGAAFVLQSGRRRLAACRELGIVPRAFLSLEPGDARHNDLQERFFENAARKNLTLVEKLYSIGLLASDLSDMSQRKIAEALGVGQAYVSRGISVVEYFERLSSDLDLAQATSRDIDDKLKDYRSNEPKADSAEAKRKRKERKAAQGAPLPFRKRTVGPAQVSLKSNAAGERILALKGKDLGDDLIEKILDVIAKATSDQQA